jgi:hypothetical protein
MAKGFSASPSLPPALAGHYEEAQRPQHLKKAKPGVALRMTRMDY